MNRNGQPRKIDTIIFLVENIERSVEFFRDILKLNLKLKSPTWAEFVIDELHLALHQRDLEKSPGPRAKACLDISIQFEVEDFDDHIDFLQLHGVEIIGGIKEHKFGRYAFFVDPDGHILGIREYKNVNEKCL